MQTKTKVLIGLGAAGVGAFLCYKYCPCFNKASTPVIDEGVVTPDYMGASPTDLGAGQPVRKSPYSSFMKGATSYNYPVVIE